MRKYVRIEEKQLFAYLPETVIESDLSIEAKKTLGALLYWKLNSKALQTKTICISNALLRGIAGIKQDSMFKAFAELKAYGLLERRVGTTIGDASEYKVNFKALQKPIKKLTFEDMFRDELEDGEPSGTPMGTTLHNISLHNITSHNISSLNITSNNISLHNISSPILSYLDIEKNLDTLLDLGISFNDYLSKLNNEVGIKSFNNQCLKKLEETELNNEDKDKLQQYVSEQCNKKTKELQLEKDEDELPF